MNKAIILLMLVVVSFSCKNKENTHQERKQNFIEITEEEALNLLHTWTDAYLTKNTTSLKEILDDSWVYSGSANGKVSDKATAIKEFSNADYTFQNIHYEALDVRLYGDIAVVRGKESLVIIGTSGQDTTKLRLRFTDVYQKTGGKIRAISTHSSPVNDD